MVGCLDRHAVGRFLNSFFYIQEDQVWHIPGAGLPQQERGQPPLPHAPDRDDNYLQTEIQTHISNSGLESLVWIRRVSLLKR